MKSIVSIFFAVTLSLVVSIVIFPAYPVMAQGTIHVPGDYNTIQGAINAAYPGDTVCVDNGTYNENIVINKSLTLTGDTGIIHTQAPNYLNPAVSITGQSNVTISNLTIRNDGLDSVYISACNNISLINNNIYSEYHEGVYIKNSSGINLVDNDIQSNGTSGFADGVYIGGNSDQSGFNLAGNYIHDSHAGMEINRLLNSTISNNTISNNTWHGIYLSSSNGNTITGNTISNNGGAGIFISGSSNNQVYNNNFINNLTWQVFISSGQNIFNLAKADGGGNYWSNWIPPEHPDTDGDGFVDGPYEFGGGQDDLPWVLQDGWKNSPATVDIKPDTLNLNTKGKWITCYIELEEGSDVADIDVTTIKLNDAVSAQSRPNGIGDYDEDGIPDLMVKFDRTSVQEIPLEVGDEVEIVITGELDGTSFKGTDTIRVIDKSND